MAANDELSRGLALYDAPGSGQASVTFPAAPGISWKVTEISWVAIGQNVAVAQDGSIIIVGFLQVDSFIINVENGFQKDSGSWQGECLCPVGVAITVEFSGGIVNGQELILATAEPV